MKRKKLNIQVQQKQFVIGSLYMTNHTNLLGFCAISHTNKAKQFTEEYPTVVGISYGIMPDVKVFNGPHMEKCDLLITNDLVDHMNANPGQIIIPVALKEVKGLGPVAIFYKDYYIKMTT